MQVEALATPVEQFVIKILPRTGGATLRMEWYRTAASIPFTIQ
jgi:hypothetical protein